MSQRKKQLFALLLAALVIASSPAISANIPAMIQAFPNTSQTMINLFTTIPAMFIIMGVFFAHLIERKIGQKNTILLGLAMVTIFGTMPVWYSQSFSVLFLSRCLFGLGIGFFNRLIIQNISQLYATSKAKKARALGLESAFEGLGGIVMTIFVGQLVTISWQTSFIVYAIAIIGFIAILIVFPRDTEKTDGIKMNGASNEKISPPVKTKMIQLSMLLFVIVGLFIIFNLQITSMLIEKRIGGATQGSNMIAGISIGAFIAGNLFGVTYRLLSRTVLPVATCLAGIFILLTTFSSSVLLIMVFSGGLGFAFRNIMPFFNHLFTSSNLNEARFGTTAILIAYNLGSTLSPYFIQGINYLGVTQASLILRMIGFIFIGMGIVIGFGIKKISLDVS